jgi:hypothetical protein
MRRIDELVETLHHGLARPDRQRPEVRERPHLARIEPDLAEELAH